MRSKETSDTAATTKPALRRGRQTKRERWVAAFNGQSTHEQRVRIAERLAKEKENCDCAECVANRKLSEISQKRRTT